MTKDEAREIIKSLEHWNTAQRSVSSSIGHGRTKEDDIFDARRDAIVKAWKVIGETEDEKQ